MPTHNWIVDLRAARKRPAMFQGSTEWAHVTGITEPLRLVWEKRALERPIGATVVVSPKQYHVRCETGSLPGRIASLVDWSMFDTLLEALLELQQRVVQVDAGWAHRFRSATFSFVSFGCPLYLADRGVLGIRTPEGLWCQAYDHGWPQTPPFLVEDEGVRIGLMVAAALNPQFCTGLPYTPEVVERVIPAAAKPYVRIEWRPKDDILPECVPDPRCVLHPENIARWL
jgi:hypothetical protein